jgi:polyisoprenyl-phosphate glycosyltransferase
VVVPVYNSEKTLAELTDRIIREISVISSDYEIIFVDDCSTDKSWEILRQLHAANKRIKVIHLQQNFGQHNATLCGLNYATGDYIVTLDDDLQHPPEEIHKLVDKIQEGYSVVYGQFRVKNHHWLENFFSARFQSLIHNILEIPVKIQFTGFVIYSSDVVKNMVSIKTSYVYLHALVVKSVSINRITNVEVDHHPRKMGKSNYNLRKYLSHSLKLIINYSALPLIILGFFGFVMSIFSFCIGIYIIINYLIDRSYGIMGWNSIMVTITFIGGMILFSIAILGEYLRRILTEVSYGQQYVIADMEI